MTIDVLRGEEYQSFVVPKEGVTLLEALTYIKANLDATLTFSAGCRASVCGTCSVRVNGVEKLACSHKVVDGDKVEPLMYHTVLRDLKVDKMSARHTLYKSNAWLQKSKEALLTPKDESLSSVQSDCILCSSCFSSCPVLEVNSDFLGPFALTRVYRYTVDGREDNTKALLESVQESGIWDCTVCGACTMVCPKGIDPKADILNLRSLSVQAGYEDKSFSGGMDFGGGFDPNGGFGF